MGEWNGAQRPAASTTMQPQNLLADAMRLIEASDAARTQTVERRACTEHGMALVEQSLERSSANLRRSMELLIRAPEFGW